MPESAELLAKVEGFEGFNVISEVLPMEKDGFGFNDAPLFSRIASHVANCQNRSHSRGASGTAATAGDQVTARRVCVCVVFAEDLQRLRGGPSASSRASVRVRVGWLHVRRGDHSREASREENG